MKGKMLSKALTVAVIILFVGVGINPAIATVEPKEDLIDVEPKNYLFQTIIDIANNPEVKELLQQYKYDLFKVDIDKSIYSKIILGNPRLLRSLLFTKSCLTYEFLDKTYNHGIEITNVIGEDKVLELIESIEVSDTEIFDEFNNIISKDKELSYKLETLKEMNKEQNSDWFPLICSILDLLFMPIVILYDLHKIFRDFYFISLFIAFVMMIGLPYWFVIIYLEWGFRCF